MKKNYLLLFLLALIGWSSGAWAQLPFQFKSWNQGDSRWKIYASNPAYYKSQEVEFTSTGDLTVKFHYESGNKRFDFYGIDLVGADGTVKKLDYRHQFSGSGNNGNNNDRTCTLSGVESGTYTLRYWTSQYLDGINWLSPGTNSTVGKIQFTYTGIQSSEKSLSEDSWSKLDGFTKAEAQEVPEGVSREIVKKGWGENPYQYYWDDENVQLNAGGYQAHFQYGQGAWGLNLRAVQVLKDGQLVSEDRHDGFIGGTPNNADYTITISETGTYTIRTIVYQNQDSQTIYHGNNCSGTVTYTATGVAKEVTYKVWDAASAEAATEGTLLGEYTVTEITNNPPSGISQISGLDYVTIHNQSELPAVVTEETNVINLYTTATLPFEVGHTYTISLYDKYAYRDPEAPTTVGQTRTAYTAATKDNYGWMFYGDWYNGFIIGNVSSLMAIGTANGTANGNAASLGSNAAHFEYEKVSDSKWVLKVKGSNPAAYLAHTADASTTINFYNDKNNAGTGITLGEINLNNYTVHINVPEGYQKTGLTATIADQTYSDGQKVEYAGTLTTADITATLGDLLQSPTIDIDEQNNINISYEEIPYLSTEDNPVYVHIKNLYKSDTDFTSTPQNVYQNGNKISVPGNSTISEEASIWQLFKGANGGVYLQNLSTGLRFTNVNQQPNQQGTLMHIFPNSNNGRTGYAIRSTTSGNGGAWALDGGTQNVDVAYKESTWASAVWQFETVDIGHVNEIVANELLAAFDGTYSNQPFTPIQSRFQDAVNALRADKTNAENLAALKNLMANPDNYNPLPNGRYFVHNYYHYDKENNENNLTQLQSTLTSLTELVGTAGKVAGYWSVWDITRNTETGLYTMVNEGNKYVMKPGSSNNYSNMQTDEGYLYYKPGYNDGTKYRVGTPTTNDVKELKFTPAVSLYDASFNGVSLADRKGYVIISGSHSVQNKQDCAMYMDAAESGKAHVDANLQDHRGSSNSGDNIIKSGQWASAKEECLWRFYQLDTEEGNSQELRLFDDATSGSLVGCVGGVITLDNVGGIDCLRELKETIENGLRQIAAKGAGYEQTAGARAGKYKDILTKIEAIRTDKTSEHNNSQYYQDLRPNTTNPFYLENISAERPSLYSRLISTDTEAGQRTQDNKNDYYWHTVANESVGDATPAGQFYSTIVSGEGTTEAVYTLKNGNGKYLGVTDKGKFTKQATDANATGADAIANFTLQMVIPGIYQMKQTNNNYFLVSGSAESNGLKGYDAPEISALWRFVTHNTVNVNAEKPIDYTDFKAPTEDGSESETYKPVFTTFSCGLNASVEKSKCIRPHYLSDIRIRTYYKVEGDNHHYYDKPEGEYTEVKRMYIQMTPVPEIDGKYWMEANEGYLLVGSEKQRQNTAGETVTGITPDDIKMLASADDMPNTYETIAGKNFFSATVGKEITIYAETMHDYFALQYTFDKIGTWNGEPVYGEGLGFYNLKAGNKIGRNKAYIRTRIFADKAASEGKNIWEGYDPNGTGDKQDWTYGGGSNNVKEIFESGTGFGICLTDTKGNVTSIIEVDGKGRAEQHAIYDLQGRRVEKAAKGVYIVNGQKVLFQ